MARIRNPSANSAISPRKRSLESLSPSRSPKRFQEWNTERDVPAVVMVSPPTRKVHWGKGSRIISGPSSMDPERRSQSPTRSALRRPAVEDEHGDFEGDDVLHGPSAQLQADLCQAEKEAWPVKLYPPKKASNPDAQAGNATVESRETKAKVRLSSGTNADDVNVCKQIDDLKSQISEHAKSFPSRPKKARSDALAQLIRPQNEQLMRYVGCIALGGGTGAAGLQRLLTDDASRKAVVWGVVGKALKDNVFDKLYFGAWPELEEKLMRMEREQARQDGFYRQRCRSDEIAKQEAGSSRAKNQNAFHRAAARVTLGLETLLLPLWSLGGKATESTWLDSNMHSTLFDIVLSAANLARAMRKTRDVIYYWPPTLKDEEFEPACMECLNLNDMIRHSPYDRQEVQGRDLPMLREGYDDQSQAIVRVVCFPGIQAYRQGGGELAKRQLAAERSGEDLSNCNDNAPPDVVAVRRRITNRHGEEYTGNEGIRTRIISKGVVLLQWGQQRLLTKEAGTSIHIDAIKNGKMQKYADDSAGHVELFRLFEARVGSARASHAKAPPQRSPSLIARGFKLVFGNAEEEEEEGPLPIADHTQLHGERDAVKRSLLGVPSAPRSRKGSRR